MDNIKEKTQMPVKTMGFAMIAASFAFYFIPDLAMFDLLPDIIAYILLAVGLARLSYLNESIDSSRKLFLRMILIGAAKLVSLFIIFGTGGNSKEQPSLMLLMVFVFVLLESFMLIPAYIKLFDGLLYLGTRHEGTAVFGKSNDHDRKNASEKMKRSTLLFIIVKNLCVLLPETSALSTTDNINSYKPSMYEFVNDFRILGMIVSLIFGIVWLVRSIKYFRSIDRDKAFVSSLCERYNTEILPNNKIFAERRIALSCLFFGIAAVLAVDFYIEGNNGYNIIPDVLMAISSIFGFIMIKKYIPKRLFVASEVACAIYGVTTSLNWKLVSDFSYEYTAAQVRTDKEANEAWRALVGMSVIEAVCFLALATLIIITVMKIIDGHTGYVVEHYTIDPKQKLAELHSRLKAPLYAAGAFGVLTAVGCVFRVFMFRYATELADSSWVIESIVTAVFAAILSFALFRVNEEVREKYMY